MEIHEAVVESTMTRLRLVLGDYRVASEISIYAVCPERKLFHSRFAPSHGVSAQSSDQGI